MDTHPLVLLSMLAALKDHFQNLHWKAKGENFYSDHKLFQKVYESFDDDYDTWAEKIITIYGADTIDIVKLSEAKTALLSRWNNKLNSHILRTVGPINELQTTIKSVYETMSDKEHLTLGADDFLMALADKQDKNHYMLLRRAK